MNIILRNISLVAVIIVESKSFPILMKLKIVFLMNFYSNFCSCSCFICCYNNKTKPKKFVKYKREQQGEPIYGTIKNSTQNDNQMTLF